MMKLKTTFSLVSLMLLGFMGGAAWAQEMVTKPAETGIIRYPAPNCMDYCRNPDDANSMTSRIAKFYPSYGAYDTSGRSKAISDCCACQPACDASGAPNPNFKTCVYTELRGGASTCPTPSGPGAPDICNNAINIVASGGSTVDVNNINQCCQFIKNTGTIDTSTLSQDCLNIFGTPPPETAPTAATGPTGPATVSSGLASTTPALPNTPVSSSSGGCALVRTQK